MEDQVHFEHTEKKKHDHCLHLQLLQALVYYYCAPEVLNM